MTAIKIAESLGRMFYLVSPSRHFFVTQGEVEPYVSDATIWFLFFIAAELIYFTIADKRKGLKRHDGKWDQGKYRMNDMIGSLGAGSVQQMSRFFLGSLQMVTYNYIWDNYRLPGLAFETFHLLTWIGCFLATDFMYYWVSILSFGILRVAWLPMQAVKLSLCLTLCSCHHRTI
jgi:alkylglycerol monooxygenase